jgi:hypothetical protein
VDRRPLSPTQKQSSLSLVCFGLKEIFFILLLLAIVILIVTAFLDMHVRECIITCHLKTKTILSLIKVSSTFVWVWFEYGRDRRQSDDRRSGRCESGRCVSMTRRADG